MNSAITGCEHPAPLVSVGRREREKDEGQMERKKEAQAWRRDPSLESQCPDLLLGWWLMSSIGL